MVDDLYQEIILDHSKRPRNFHVMDDANRRADGYNPLCGDKLEALSQDGRRRGAGCQLHRRRLRDLYGFGFADDRIAQGQEPRGSAPPAG